MSHVCPPVLWISLAWGRFLGLFVCLTLLLNSDGVHRLCSWYSVLNNDGLVEAQPQLRFSQATLWREAAFIQTSHEEQRRTWNTWRRPQSSTAFGFCGKTKPMGNGFKAMAEIFDIQHVDSSDQRRREPYGLYRPEKYRTVQTLQNREVQNRADSTDPWSTEPCRLYRPVKYRTVQTLQTREVQNRVDSTTREAENLLDSKTQRIREPCGLLEERNFTV